MRVTSVQSTIPRIHTWFCEDRIQIRRSSHTLPQPDTENIFDGPVDLRAERGRPMGVRPHPRKTRFFTKTPTESIWVSANKTRLVGSPFYDARWRGTGDK